MTRLRIISILTVFLFCGCAWFQSKEEKSVQELASDGVEAYRKGQYKRAIESFQRLRDWYPFSKYAILAELKIADAHYQLKEYEDAVYAYENFENLHPKNEAVPYVIYQIGRCYFDQIDSVDRDQTAAGKALDAFLRLQKQFPDDPYSKKADDLIRSCFKSLAGHELYVGRFYYRAKRYRSALQRFMRIISEFPDVGLHQEALRYVALCETALKNEPEETKRPD